MELILWLSSVLSQAATSTSSEPSLSLLSAMATAVQAIEDEVMGDGNGRNGVYSII